MTPTERELRVENERLRQAYDYILASRNDVDKELNEAKEQLQQERNKARNQAIDDCIQAVLEYQNIIFEGKNFAKKLESLKTKP